MGRTYKDKKVTDNRREYYSRKKEKKFKASWKKKDWKKIRVEEEDE